jgi:hypothetical protein
LLHLIDILVAIFLILSAIISLTILVEGPHSKNTRAFTATAIAAIGTFSFAAVRLMFL